MKAEIDLKKMNDWYTRLFEELVEKYPGKAVAIVNGKIVEIGETEVEVDRLARRRFPEEIPLVVTVPTPEELVCLLYG
jgi:enamine deaminase RidA (YjgF/YER057c/UK114 family)